MKNKRNSILAFVPPNKAGEMVLKEALILQRTLHMKIYVLNVIKAPSFYARVFQAKKVKNLLTYAEKELVEFVKNSIHEEIPDEIEVSIKSGDVVSILLNESNKGGHEFILIDKSKYNYEGVMGKNKIDDLVSESKCPVLTVNKDFGVPEIKNIIIPIDITQTTKKRLLWAILFAKKYNAKITILSALNADVNERKSLAYKNANKIRHMLWEHDVECDVKVIKTHSQDNHKVILEYIEKESPELVIIRTHQNSLFANTSIGGFVSEIVHGCTIPVFTVNYTPNSLKTLFS